jgi:hypothetical protein
MSRGLGPHNQPVHLTGATTVRRWSESGNAVLVILGARTDDLQTDPELAHWLNGLERDARTSWLEISELQLEDVIQLAGIPDRW